MKYTNYDIETVVHGYLTAALETTLDEDDEPLSVSYSEFDFTRTVKRKVEMEIEEFVEDINSRGLLKPYIDAMKQYFGNEDKAWEQLGIDLWLSRNGHGSGFFDKFTVDKNVRDELQKLANDLGEVYLIAGDDGELYFEQ